MTITLSTTDCHYKAHCGKLSAVWNSRFPADVYVESHHTGRVVLFHPIGEDHPLFDQDGWDGEQAVYEPAIYEAGVKAKVLVLYHGG